VVIGLAYDRASIWAYLQWLKRTGGTMAGATTAGATAVGATSAGVSAGAASAGATALLVG